MTIVSICNEMRTTPSTRIKRRATTHLVASITSSSGTPRSSPTSSHPCHFESGISGRDTGANLQGAFSSGENVTPFANRLATSACQTNQQDIRRRNAESVLRCRFTMIGWLVQKDKEVCSDCQLIVGYICTLMSGNVGGAPGLQVKKGTHRHREQQNLRRIDPRVLHSAFQSRRRVGVQGVPAWSSERWTRAQSALFPSDALTMRSEANR